MSEAEPMTPEEAYEVPEDEQLDVDEEDSVAGTHGDGDAIVQAREAEPEFALVHEPEDEEEQA